MFPIHVVDDDLDTFFGLSSGPFARLNSMFVKAFSFELTVGGFVVGSHSGISTLISGSDCGRRASLRRCLIIANLYKSL